MTLKREYTKEELDGLKRQIKECDKSKPYVFVSYSSKDAGVVYSDVIELQKRGANIWIDKELEKNIGSNWLEIAIKAMKSAYCKMVLFYISEDSMISQEVCRELLYSMHKDIRKYNQGKPLDIIPVDLVRMDGNNISDWVLIHICEKYGNDNHEVEFSFDDLKAHNKFEVALIILEEIFTGSNAQTRLAGFDEHTPDYFNTLIGNFERRKREKDKFSVVNQIPDIIEAKVEVEVKKETATIEVVSEVKKETTINEEAIEVPKPKTEIEVKPKKLSVKKEEKKPKPNKVTNVVKNDNSIDCEILGEKYSFPSQSEWMFTIFEKVMNLYPNKIDLLLNEMSCLSHVDYSIKENRVNMKSQFRNCRTFLINGKEVCVGSSYSIIDKRSHIKKLLELCSKDAYLEDFDVVDPSLNKEEITSNAEKNDISLNDIRCRIYDKEYTFSSQSDMMIEIFKKVIEKHHDKVDLLGEKLTSVAIDNNTPEMKEKLGKSTFNRKEEMNVKGKIVAIGTNFGLQGKASQIRRLLFLCSEKSSIVDCDIINTLIGN